MTADIPGVVRGLTRSADEIDRPRQPKPGVLRLLVRCDRARTKQGLFEEFSAALQFPLFFAWHWDSFTECLGDLSWWPGDRDLEINLVDVDQLLADDRSARAVFIEIMRDLFGKPSPDSFITFVGYERAG